MWISIFLIKDFIVLQSLIHINIIIRFVLLYTTIIYIFYTFHVIICIIFAIKWNLIYISILPQYFYICWLELDYLHICNNFHITFYNIYLQITLHFVVLFLYYFSLVLFYFQQTKKHYWMQFENLISMHSCSCKCQLFFYFLFFNIKRDQFYFFVKW